MSKIDRLLLLGALAIMLSACSMSPTYAPPSIEVPAQFKSSSGPWIAAQPSDHFPREGWWQIYGDERLDQLENKLAEHNNDLSEAEASYREAEAFLAQARASLFPQVNLNGSITRNRQSDTAPLRNPIAPAIYNSSGIGIGISYETDLWGSVHEQIVASKAMTQAAAADLASVRLSLEATLADVYMTIVGLDRQLALLDTTIASYERAVKLVQVRASGGLVPELDVDRAQAQLSATRAQRLQTMAQRTLLEHAMAVLVGEPASSFTLAVQNALPAIPVIPVGVPSGLLQRRPDIASAERQVAAANARVGVAKSAFFPALILNAGAGTVSSIYHDVFTASSHVWSIGPALAENLFDGGARRSRVDAAQAALDSASAHYRGIVLIAFQQVEDNQTLLIELNRAAADQLDAVNAEDRALKLTTNLYLQGAGDYLDVLTAQVTALQVHLTLLVLQTTQLRASVQLVRALGGGWTTTSRS